MSEPAGEERDAAMQYDVFRDREAPRDWRVEAFGESGECYITVFGGDDAEARAREYAELMNSGALASPLRCTALVKPPRTMPNGVVLWNGTKCGGILIEARPTCEVCELEGNDSHCRWHPLAKRLTHAEPTDHEPEVV